jgi:hypothetical protein
LFGTGATAEEGDFDFNGLIAKKALRDYKKALVEDKKAIELRRKKLDEEADSLAKTARDAFVENLTKALKQSMQAGNLDEANKINDAIKALKKGASPAGASVAGSNKAPAQVRKVSIKADGGGPLRVKALKVFIGEDDFPYSSYENSKVNAINMSSAQDITIVTRGLKIKILGKNTKVPYGTPRAKFKAE